MIKKLKIEDKGGKIKKKRRRRRKKKKRE